MRYLRLCYLALLLAAKRGGLESLRWTHSHARPTPRKETHMRMRLVLLFSLLLGQLVWAQPLVIKRVTVIDATGGPSQPDMTVVISANRIVAVSPSKKAKLPTDAQVVD